LDIQAFRAQADEVIAQFERMRAGYGELQQKLRAVTATASSEDGSVTATVGPRGQLVKLELDPRIYRRPDSRKLAVTITETVRTATEQALAKVAELCQPFVPDAQFQAHLNYDFDGLFGQLDSDLPKEDA
jgi:DNA-binding protein YbaB